MVSLFVFSLSLREMRHTLDLLSVSRTSVVRVDLLRCRALVERDEAVEEVVARGVVVVAAVVIGEVVSERRARELLREQVDLVKEQDLNEEEARIRHE